MIIGTILERKNPHFKLLVIKLLGYHIYSININAVLK